MEQLVGKLSFRVQQLNVRVETKTLDNVFLVAVVSVQYQVLREKVYEAFYALTNPAQQITAHGTVIAVSMNDSSKICKILSFSYYSHDSFVSPSRSMPLQFSVRCK